MHGGAHGHDHIGHILGDAGVLRLTQVGGDGGGGGAGAQRHDGGPCDVLEHSLDAVPAAADIGEEGKGGEDVDKAQGIVHHHGPAIGGGHAGAVGGYQIRKQGEEGDGGVIGDDLHKGHHHFGQAVEELADDVVGAAHQIGGKAEQDGEDDQRQHGAAAQQAHKVVGGEEVHDHVGEGGVLADGLGGHVGPGLQHRGNQLHDNEHDDGGNGAGDHEGEHGGAHDLACPFPAAYAGHGIGDGGEHQRHHHAEHHIDEHGAGGLDKVTKFRKEPAGHAAGYHGKQHQGQEAVVLHNCGFVHNNTSLSSNTQNCRWGMRRHLLSQCTAPAAALSLKGAVPRR